MNEEEEEEEEEEEFIEDLEDLGGGGGGKGKGGNVVGKITRELPNQPKNGFVFGGHRALIAATSSRRQFIELRYLSVRKMRMTSDAAM